MPCRPVPIMPIVMRSLAGGRVCAHAAVDARAAGALPTAIAAAVRNRRRDTAVEWDIAPSSYARAVGAAALTNTALTINNTAHGQIQLSSYRITRFRPVKVIASCRETRR